MGVYCFFSNNPGVKLNSAVEAPTAADIQFSHITSVSLGGVGEITHVLNALGETAHPGHEVSRMP